MSAAGRLLGIDYGSVRIGLAVSDAERRIASPLETYRRRDTAQDSRYFSAVIQQQEIAMVIVGLPMHTDGREGQKAAEVRTFSAWLATVTALPIAHWDERFTTVEAESHLWSAGLSHKRRKERRDRVAAQIMLQAYLEAGCPPGS